MTPREQLANLEALEKFWAAIPPTTVNLYRYRDDTHDCGTLYCIGGHMAHTGFLGVCSSGGEPIMHYEGGRLYGYEIAEHLFGDQNLFDRRHEHMVDGDLPPTASDYEVAMHRIRWLKMQRQGEVDGNY